MAETIRYVEVIVGHSSTKLNEPTDKEHTHKWTLFVKPANKEYEDFPDNKVIQKVKFQIHESFPNPTRYVTKPPFRITETGFGSFSTYVTIYLNLPNEKPHTIPYELDLFTGEKDVHMGTQKLVIRGDNVSASFLDQARRFAKSKKRKASVISSSNDERSPSKVHRGELEKSSEKKKSSGHDSSSKSKKSSKESEKKEKKPVKSAEELTKKLNNCTDNHVLYKASEFLLTLPDTKLSIPSHRLTFDLSKCETETLAEIQRILKSTKNSSRH